MSTLDMFPHMPRRLTHEEILAGFAELLRAVPRWSFGSLGREKPFFSCVVRTQINTLRTIARQAHLFSCNT